MLTIPLDFRAHCTICSTHQVQTKHIATSQIGKLIIMAISKPKRPALIVSGTAVAVTPRTKFDEATRRYTDELTGYEIMVAQESGAQLSVRYSGDRDGNIPPIPNALDRVAVVVEVTESREYGASLVYIRDVIADDLDKIASALPSLSSK